MEAPAGQSQTIESPLASLAMPPVAGGDDGGVAAPAVEGLKSMSPLSCDVAIKADPAFSAPAVLLSPPGRPSLAASPLPPLPPIALDASRPDGSQLAALCASLPESIDLSLLTAGRGVEVTLSPLGTLPPLVGGGGSRRTWPNGWTEPADLLEDPDGGADDDDDDDDTSPSRAHDMQSAIAAVHGAREGGGGEPHGAAPTGELVVGSADPDGGDGSSSPPSSGRSSTRDGSSSVGSRGNTLPPTGKVIARGRAPSGRGGGSGTGSLSSRTDRRKRERAAQLEREVTALLTRLMQLHDETSRIEEGNLRLLESLMEKNRNKAMQRAPERGAPWEA